MIDKLPPYILIKKVFLMILIPAIFTFLFIYYQNIKTQHNAIVAQLAISNHVTVGGALHVLLSAGFSIEEACENLYTNSIQQSLEKAKNKR